MIPPVTRIGGIPFALFLSLVLWTLIALTCYGAYKLLT